MLICPDCKAVLKKVPESGVCPKCGHAVRDLGAETEGPHAPTLGVTQEFTPPAEERDTKEPAATMELPAVEKGRSISIAPRKLSAKNVELITNTWQAAVAGESDQLSPIHHTLDLFDMITAPKRLVLYQDANHSVAQASSSELGENRESLVYDWLRDRVDAKPCVSEKVLVDSAGKMHATPY